MIIFQESDLYKFYLWLKTKSTDTVIRLSVLIFHALNLRKHALTQRPYLFSQLSSYWCIFCGTNVPSTILYTYTIGLWPSLYMEIKTDWCMFKQMAVKMCLTNLPVLTLIFQSRPDRGFLIKHKHTESAAEDGGVVDGAGVDYNVILLLDLNTATWRSELVKKQINQIAINWRQTPVECFHGFKKYNLVINCFKT